MWQTLNSKLITASKTVIEVEFIRQSVFPNRPQRHNLSVAIHIHMWTLIAQTIPFQALSTIKPSNQFKSKGKGTEKRLSVARAPHPFTAC